METIYQNLQTPAWWFTGCFFIFLVYAVKKVSLHLPLFIKGYFRNRKYKKLVLIRKHRSSQASINYEITRTHSYFMVFLSICGLYLVWFTSSSMSELIKEHPLAAAIIGLPIFITEILWLFKNEYCKLLVKEHNKTLKYAHKKRGPDALKRTV
jgi:hypothetical protein